MTAPCLHPQARHEHGDRLAYCLDGCRCGPCRRANSAYEAERARRKAYGRPTTPLVDAEPARQHIRAVCAAGLGWKRAAAAAGVHGSTVSRLLYGRKRAGGHVEPPTQRIAPATAAALLAVPIPGPDQLADAAAVDGTGTRRRLQALVAAGWSQTRLAARLGMEPGNFSGLILARRADDVLAGTRRAVVDLYDELWNVPPPPGVGVARARRTAAERRWVPPLAWDDDTIDDPAASPAVEDGVDLVDEHAVDLVLDGQPMRLAGQSLEEAVARLSAAGLGIAAIADRVRSDEATVRRIRDRVHVRAARATARAKDAA